MKYINNFKMTMSVMLIVVFSTTGIAQENATDFLKDYYPIGAFIQYTNNSKGTVVKEDPTVNYGLPSYVTAQYGFVYNIYQTKRWNFKTGLILKPKALKESLNFTIEQTDANFDFPITTVLSGDDKMWSFPLIAEYIVPISNKVKWIIAPSFTISIYKDFGGSGLNSRGPSPAARMIFVNDDRSDKPLHTSAELSTGFYFPLKHIMLQPEIRYSKSFNTLKSGSYTTENYRTTPNSSTGTFKQSGDYWGFSLTVYIKKKGRNR
ncbi:MAG: hypothetical protein L3J14_02435 [Flavobacteriaceae bacterium]|nr:hypothetical protein [Flavobacteriaceae bacterium]